jgi:hypothetical protein
MIRGKEGVYRKRTQSKFATDVCEGRGIHQNEGIVLDLVGVSLSKRPTQAYKGNENVLLTSYSTHRWMIGSIGKGRNRSLRRICAKE